MNSNNNNNGISARDYCESMRGVEEMDIDEIVDVPDTPDRLAARRVISRESMGRDGDSSISGNFRGRDTLNENHVNGLRVKDKPLAQHGHFRRPPTIRPPKSFYNHRTTNFISPNVVSSSENSFASGSPKLFRKVYVDESSSHIGKHTSGVRNMDKGKSVSIDKSSNYQEDSKFCDLTKPNGCAENPKTVCPNGVAKDKKKGPMVLSGSSSGPRIHDSSEMFRNANMGNGKIDENAPKGSGLATPHGIGVNLSSDSQHKTGEGSFAAVSSPRVPGRKCLVRNGCISPQNIAKAELLKSSSRIIEQSHTANGDVDFTQPRRDLISELIAQENDSRRMKGKAVLTIPDTSKEKDEIFFSGTSSSVATDSREANGITNARRDAFDSQGLGGWRRTHNHSGKPDIIIPDADGRLSQKIRGAKSFSHQQQGNRVDRRESGQNRRIECDNAEGETAVRAAPNVSETGQSSGRPRSEKKVTKRLKKQRPTSMTHGECSTSASEDPDFLTLDSPSESMKLRSSRAQAQSWDRFCPVIEIEESPPVRRSMPPQSLDSTNDDDSEARARQVEADEILARELQEQLYHELPIVGGDEFDERLVWAMQQEGDGSNTYSARQNASDSRRSVIADLRRHTRLQPTQSRPIGGDEIDEQLAWVLQQDDDVFDSFGTSQNASNARASVIPNLIRQPRSRPAQSRPNRTQNQPSRRGTLARVANPNRMAQLRGRANRQHRAVSHRARNLQFPLEMDLDVRLDILETLEAAFENFRDVDIDNPIYQLQRDFNENDYEMLLALDEHNHQHAGASSNRINSLPESVVQTDNQEACAICLESPTIGETVRHLPCLHKFHKDCIDPWLSRKTSCPVCKCSIT